MNFFDTNSYFIDEKVNFFQFENSYKIFNNNGIEIGSVRQKLSTGQKILRLLLSKAMLPFHLEIKDIQGNTQSSISRGWTFFMSKIQINDSHGVNLGLIQQKFKFFKPTFNIFNSTNQPIAIITGDWKAWEFVIKDSDNRQIGTISKKWNGVAKEFFTSADKYNVEISPEYKNGTGKIIIISCAITVDMVLKESK